MSGRRDDEYVDDSQLDANSIPEESSPIASTSAARVKLKSPKERTSSEQVVDIHNGEVSLHTLNHFLHFHPFANFFGWLADKQHPESFNGSTRFRKHKLDHPGFYWVCVWVDFLLLLIVVFVILVAVSITIYKTLWL